MPWDEDRIAVAAEILSSNTGHVIYKTTRAGCTTSMQLAAERLGIGLLTVAPTNAINNCTVRKAGKDIAGIFGNCACRYLMEEIEEEPLLAELPMSLPGKCGPKCPEYLDCPVTEIERNPNAVLKTINTAKLCMLMLTSTGRARKIIDTLKKTVKFSLIDESHKISVGNVAQLPTKTRFYDLCRKLEGHGYEQLKVVINKWSQLTVFEIQEEERDLWSQIEQDPDNWLVREVINQDWIIHACVLAAHGELRKLVKERTFYNVTDQEIRDLAKAIQILSNVHVRLSYIKSSEAEEVYLASSWTDMELALKMFFAEVRCKPLFVSGTQFEKHYKYYSKIAGQALKDTIFPDLKNTNDKMTVYADTWKFGTLDRNKHSHIIARILEISKEHPDNDILVVATNKEWFKKLTVALKPYSKFHVDFYRSSNMMGVESPYRIMIAIALAEIPKNAADTVTSGYVESQNLRIQLVDADSAQAWGRAKDPDGLVDSVVYVIGARPEDVDRALTWGPSRSVIFNGKKASVTCEPGVGKPKLMVPYKKQANARLRKASPYIKTVWNSEEDLTGCPIPVYEISSTKNVKTTYIYIRVFNGNRTSNSVRCFGALYMNPQNEDEIRITIETLDRFFRSKRTQHAEQNPNGSYYPHNTVDWQALIRGMLNGEVTPAMYCVGEDGLTVQCAFDIDDHKGTNPAMPRLITAIGHVKELGAQPVVIASGSVDSYHVHIPIVRVPIETSHEFIKTMYNELKQSNRELDFKHDTEAFPKQGNAHHPFGNALKLPMALNRKAGKRSQLLDYTTLGPVDVIYITKVIELRQPEKVAVQVGTKQYLPATASSARSGTMRPCVLSALNTLLEGSEGNDMRVAIVCEALAAGKSRDEIIRLFAGQADYNETITAKYVDYIIGREYRPWRCETLQEKCPTLVDCTHCPRCPVAECPDILVEPAMAR